MWCMRLVNFTCLSFTAACRIRESALCTTSRSCARLVFCRRGFPLASPPWLHPLRFRRTGFVRGLRCYYGAVRLPASVHHRRASLDFSMHPKRACWGSRRISRFSRKLLPYMPGVSDRAGYHCASPSRHSGCCLPPASTESASRVRLLSRLHTLPALSPVNASPSLLRAPPHDSGSLWLARPLTYDSFIHYNLPVYPGALRQSHSEDLRNFLLTPTMETLSFFQRLVWVVSRSA